MPRTHPPRISVAFSGGCDSSVLLHALSRLRTKLPAPLRAIHINHGLQAVAPRWARDCARFARARQIDYHAETVTIDPVDERGLEAAARAARYAALAALMAPGEWLLTAHHGDDQLETVLLQLLRGGGSAGLAAIAPEKNWAGGVLVRPLLGFGRDELQHWAAAQGLNYIADPSNDDTHFDRNYLRHDIIPRLKARWPGAATLATRTARHAASAVQMQQALAALDLKPAATNSADSLVIKPLLALGDVRAANAIRAWLKNAGRPVPSTRRLDELLRQMHKASPSAVPCVEWATLAAHVWQGRLYVQPHSGAPAPLPTHWRGAPVDLGSGRGQLTTQRGMGGVRAEVIDAGVELRWRAGGERIRLPGAAHHRPLKALLRERGLPPWTRQVPVLWYRGELVAVADLWVDAAFACADDEPGVRIVYKPCFRGDK